MIIKHFNDIPFILPQHIIDVTKKLMPRLIPAL